MGINYFFSKIKKIWNEMDTYISPDLKGVNKVFITFDFLSSVIIYGAGVNDYLHYKFYKRKHSDRKNFIVYKKRMRIVNAFNNKVDRDIFDSKEKFNKTFSNYIGRRWLSTNNMTFDDFEDFSKSVLKFIVKPVAGSHGKGLRIISMEEQLNKKKLFEELLKEEAILEELIIQHDELAEFNPNSVNTLRVVTLLCPDNKVRIMTANLRMGNGIKYADNFHHNGIAALIDVETGIVVTKGIDRLHNQYIIHPYTGKQIIGYHIPFWDKVIETVKQAARVVPSVGYIGWDVAIGKDGSIILVEGNAAADPDISQIPDQIGKWPLYKNYVIEKINSK